MRTRDMAESGAGVSPRPARAAERVPSAEPGPRYRGERPRTLPEQIADQVGAAILDGSYVAGQRVGEQEIAESFGVSRGPVREAIRALAARGLVEFLPRRGAYVVDISLDTIADLFNIRAALLGLAARCFARRPVPEGLAELCERAAAVQALAGALDTPVIAFTRAIGRMGTSLYRHCGNGHLTRMLQAQAEGSLWGLIWRERPLDFATPERRRAAADDWSAIVAAIQAGRDGEAERLTRKALFDSRDSALALLQTYRQQRLHPSRVFRDGT